MIRFGIHSAVAGLAMPLVAFALDLGTAFTYQGRLVKSGSPVTATCDFRFGLWDSFTGGNEFGASPQFVTGVPVSSGTFTAVIDFGPGAINGTARWLAIEVQCPGDATFVAMSGRARMRPSPHALALPGFRTREHLNGTPNVIGGHAENVIGSDVGAATISGGGQQAVPNRVFDNFGVVAGGTGNTAGSDDAELANGWYATVSGGSSNTASGPNASVGGGFLNEAEGAYAKVGGGNGNSAGGYIATIGGGANNAADASFGTVSGGRWNAALGDSATVGGGKDNEASGDFATIGGGEFNDVPALHATVAGGNNNQAWQWATVGGGADNVASGDHSTVAGGSQNLVTGHNASIAGGENNSTSGSASMVGGGSGNAADGNHGAVLGGSSNSASGSHSTVGGGSGNTASGDFYSTVAGGTSNTASGVQSAVGGGGANTASGQAATIPGGNSNLAGGEYSFAAGRKAKARDHDPVSPYYSGDVDGDEGTFVWADSTNADFTSSGPNQFLIRATGGVGIGTASPTATLDVAGSLEVDASTLVVDAANNRVGIGTTTPDNRLHVVGTTELAGALIVDTSTLVVSSTVNRVGIVNTTPSVELDVTGSIEYTGTLTDVSDERLKENVAPVQNALKKVGRLRGVYFSMKDTPSQREVGFMAQNVQEVLPEAVRVVDPAAGYLGVSYQSLIPLLVEAIKEMQTENDAQVADQQRQINDLRDRFDQMQRGGAGSAVHAGLPLTLLGLAGFVAFRRRNASSRRLAAGNRWVSALAVGALSALFASRTLAQSGGDYVVTKSTIDGGGISEAAGGEYLLSGTVGQADAGFLAGGDYELSGGFWSPEFAVAPPAVTAPLADAVGSHLDKNRYMSFVVPTDGMGQDTAVRVRLASLHHPAGPPNAPNFSAFEGQYRYLNAIRDSGNNPVFVCPDSAAAGTSYQCAKLGCAPEYRDWAGIFGGAPVHVTGDSVVPSSQYAIAQLASSCTGNETSCAAASSELMAGTERWGNVDGNPAGGAPNATDIGRVVDKVKDVPTAFIEPRCQLRDATPNPYGGVVNAQDIGRIVDAVKGQPYPFTISVCP